MINFLISSVNEPRLKRWEDDALHDTSPSEFELNFSGRKDLPHLDKKVRRRQKGAFQKIMEKRSQQQQQKSELKPKDRGITQRKRSDLFPNIDDGSTPGTADEILAT